MKRVCRPQSRKESIPLPRFLMCALETAPAPAPAPGKLLSRLLQRDPGSLPPVSCMMLTVVVLSYLSGD